MRIFIALNLSPEIKRIIIDSTQPLKKLTEIKWVKEENLHITLNFLGELSKTELDNFLAILPSQVQTFKPFKIILHKLIFLPNYQSPRVIALGLKVNKKIQKLHKSIQNKINELRLTSQGWKDFQSHITLGRISEPKVKIPDNLVELVNKKIPPQEVLVNSLNVMQSYLESMGPTYEVLKSFSLQTQRSG